MDNLLRGSGQLRRTVRRVIFSLSASRAPLTGLAIFSDTPI